jgi:nicotinate phosphoribosyltransferase
MKVLNGHIGLYTDFYELTMAQGYFLHGRKDETATFDYFFREQPFNGGYLIFAGLQNLLESLIDMKYDDADIEFLKKWGFKEEFLNYLKNFRFKGTINSVKEGEIVFPNEPVLSVTGNIIETQLIETMLLNTINFQSLIATKASRIRQVAGNKAFIDFGLRRAQSLGGIHASRAAIIGGANATSNTFAGFHYNIDVSGTQAHSWIQSFENEYTAFEKFAETAPGKIILLVDTYDTLKSGVPNAIKLARKLKKEGKKIDGIRLDSGDLYYYSKESRKMLDEAGFNKIKIIASNQLDEYVIKSLEDQGAPIDGFGIGTRLVTGNESSALDGIYKLSVINGKPALKRSENIEKVSLPGHKKIIRLFSPEGTLYADAIALTEESQDMINRIYHPFYPEKHTYIKGYHKESIMNIVMETGTIVNQNVHVNEIKNVAKSQLNKLPMEFKRFLNPHIYKVGISEKLLQLKNKIMKEIRSAF